MVSKTTPNTMPLPRTALGFDGSDFHALKTDADGRLIVRGEDQLFSIRGVFAKGGTSVISGADGYVESAAVGAGHYRVVTTIVAWDVTSPTTKIRLVNYHAGLVVHIDAKSAAYVAGEGMAWSGFTYQDAGDTIRAYFAGGQAGDTCRLDVTGYTMTVET